MLTAIGFLLIMLFLGQNDWFVQRKRQERLSDINQKIEFLKKGSEGMEQQLKLLNTDTAYLIKYAREHYHEKKDNEDVFLIERDTTASTNN